MRFRAFSKLFNPESHVFGLAMLLLFDLANALPTLYIRLSRVDI
jgi:hypothetical protein